MSERHLHAVPPPDVEDDDGGDDDGDVLLIESTISAEAIFSARVILTEENPTAEDIATALLSTMRGACAAYDPSVHMAFERLLMEQGAARG